MTFSINLTTIIKTYKNTPRTLKATSNISNLSMKSKKKWELSMTETKTKNSFKPKMKSKICTTNSKPLTWEPSPPSMPWYLKISNRNTSNFSKTKLSRMTRAS